MAEMNSNPVSHLSTLDADLLRRTAKWARFLAFVGFALIALIVIFGLFAGSMIGRFVAKESVTLPSCGALYSLIFLLLAVFYFFPTLFLYRFATRSLKAVNGAFDGGVFSTGLDSLRRLFAFTGVFILIVLCLYASLFLIGLIAFLAMG